MASSYSQASPPNPNLTNPDEMMDLEILKLQEELQRVRQQRQLLQLRSELAKEQQLLAEAQESLGLVKSATPVVERPRQFTQSSVVPLANGPEGGLVQGIKRSHSESSDDAYEPEPEPKLENMGEQTNAREGNQQQVVNGRENTQNGEGHNGAAENGQGQQEAEAEGAEVPPTFTVKKQYRGVNRKEYNVLIEFLESHFAQYQRYYAPDSRRIEEGLRHVTPDIARAWGNYVLSTGQTQPTWSDFHNFLMSWLPKTDPAIARRNYYGRTQRVDQTVREFSNHLGSWESQLEELLTEKQRIQNLYDRVLPEVREAARPFQYQGNSFLDHVAHLLTVESRMPSRQHLQHKMKGPRNNYPKNAPKHPNAKKPRMDTTQGT